MHKKYIQQADTFEKKRQTQDVNLVSDILDARDKRRELAPIRTSVYQLADILKFMGMGKYDPTVGPDTASLWAYATSKEDIEAFNKIVWSFGFKHVSTVEAGSIDVKYEKYGYVVSIYYYFTIDADCKLVKTGTKEVDIYERRCGSDEDAVVIDTSTIATGDDDDELAEETT